MSKHHKTITTSGQDTIHNIIERHYHPENQEAHLEAFEKIRQANPHVTSLHHLNVGDQLTLPDVDEEDIETAPATDEQATDEQQPAPAFDSPGPILDDSPEDTQKLKKNK
jgi:hypothetical protein